MPVLSESLLLNQELFKPKGSAFKLEDICFPEQLAFIKDPSPWVTASCSRRSGKTEVCAYDLLNTAVTNPGTVSLYITLTRSNAEKIVWAKLLSINEQYGLGGVPSIAKLSLQFPNNSVIYLSGCKDKSELDKFRGLAIKLVYIDEVQSFKDFIRELVDEVLGPALADHAGSLKLIGTPAPLPSGFFYETIKNNAFTHHHWTFWQNPFIAQKAQMPHKDILARELKRRGVTDEHPSVRREWFGEWTIDTESLVFQYNQALNDFQATPDLTDFVIGIDFGTDDADAIAVIGWHKHRRQSYLVEEFVKSGLTVTQIVDEVDKRIKKYNPLKVVADTGANGKKIALEIQKRTSVPIHAAEKARKVEHITWLNDALRTGHFFARSTSRFVADSYIVEWDYDKSTSDRLVIKDQPHSDICDAVLYAFTEALHWLTEPAKPKVDFKTQYVEHTKRLMDEQLEREIQREQAKEKDEDFWSVGSLDDETDILKHYLNKRRA